MIQESLDLKTPRWYQYATKIENHSFNFSTQLLYHTCFWNIDLSAVSHPHSPFLCYIVSYSITLCHSLAWHQTAPTQGSPLSLSRETAAPRWWKSHYRWRCYQHCFSCQLQLGSPGCQASQPYFASHFMFPCSTTLTQNKLHFSQTTNGEFKNSD